MSKKSRPDYYSNLVSSGHTVVYICGYWNFLWYNLVFRLSNTRLFIFQRHFFILILPPDPDIFHGFGSIDLAWTAWIAACCTAQAGDNWFCHRNLGNRGACIYLEAVSSTLGITGYWKKLIFNVVSNDSSLTKYI